MPLADDALGADSNSGASAAIVAVAEVTAAVVSKLPCQLRVASVIDGAVMAVSLRHFSMSETPGIWPKKRTAKLGDDAQFCVKKAKFLQSCKRFAIAPFVRCG